ncbi:MAG: phage tail protein [Enterobacteriaceae bacterium]|jgi:phage protein U|uniref:phage tail protein n=1 Tax=Citrobacter sp. BDA59-3 TaxID=2781952 RepID=UPI00187EB8DD|nr:phage tail protein [Citrobacter sp. BDA59-3]MDU4998178.1 phage tail protein [Enterobacteriaceae bacterium]QOV67811.1 phage tail protein [Citrobacter sp. BDA59-3]
MMMVLGFFVFMLKTIPFQQLQQQQQWRHASNNRVGKRPTMQFLGPDSDSITLSGVLMPSVTGGKLSLLVLEQMAETGRGWPLIRGDGTIYGMFVISEIGKTETDQVSSGAPRKIDFTIKLTRMDESLTQMLGDLSGQLSELKDNAISAAKNAASSVTNSVGSLLQ